MSLINHAKDIVQGKAKIGEKRSKDWKKTRKAHLIKESRCAVCNSKKKLEVHHIIPFNLDPSFELHPDNLITLCENKKYGVNCHLLFGHVGKYSDWNPDCLQDVERWHNKIQGK